MATITTRAGKGSPLTNTEVDSNFTNLNTDKIEASTTDTLTNKTIDAMSNSVGANHLHYKVKATAALSKGTVVKITGYNSGEDAYEVNAVSSASDVAVGIVDAALAIGDFGLITNTGLFEGLDTSAFSIGDILYPNTSGGFTSTKPTSGHYQAAAFVLRVHASNGAVMTEFTEPHDSNLAAFADAFTLPTTDGTSGQAVTTNGSGTLSFSTISVPQSGVDFDPVGTDNSTNVTLAGAYDYITITGQTITRNQVDYTTDISNTPTIPTNNNELTNGAGYITGNQTITLSGDVSGSGTTAITTTVANDSHSHTGSTVSGLAVSNFSGAAIQTGAEAFTDSDTVLMTAAAVQDKIESYGYSTSTGDITGVSAGNGLTGGGTSGDVTVNVGAGTGISVAADTVSVSYGTTAGTATQGNDSRVNNGQTAYGWGDHSSAGYITGNQTITLSGDVSGSGTTSIAVTVADDSHNHIISNVDGLQTALDAKAALSGASFTGAVYSTGNMGYDSTDYISWSNNAYMNITVNGSNEFRFLANGNFHADGDVIAYSTTTASDERLKDNISVVDDALSKVCALNGVTFKWKKDGTDSAGVIAQEVMNVLPQAVKEVNDLKEGSHLAVNYGALTSILIEAIKELSAEVEALKGAK